MKFPLACRPVYLSQPLDEVVTAGGAVAGLGVVAEATVEPEGGEDGGAGEAERMGGYGQAMGRTGHGGRSGEPLEDQHGPLADFAEC